MKNRKHYDNSSMSIQIKFKNEERELPDTDVNGNDNKFLSSESEATQCHEHTTALGKQLSEKQATFQNKKRVKRQDARKLPPLRISKTRLSSFQETNKDNNSTSYLHQHLKTRKSAMGQSSFKTDEKCKNIFSDFSMSHFSEMRHARTDISVKIGANKKREAKDKQQQNYPKLQVSLTLNDNEPKKDVMSRTETDIVHSVTRDNMNGNPQSLSILVCEYDTNDDNTELKSKSQNVKLTDSDSFFYNSSKDDGQNAGDPIPQLSPIQIHRTDNSFMLPSPQYSLQPPILTPISEALTIKFEDHNNFFTLKTETDTQEPSTVGISQQKSSSSLTPVHISAIKKTLKRTTCQAMENTSVERNMCEFKEKIVSLQKPHEFLPNKSEKNGSEVFENQKRHYDLKTLDNAVKNITIEGKDDPTNLLALSTKDTPSSYSHSKNNISKEIARNSKHVRYDSTVKNINESNNYNVNGKDYKSNSKSDDRKETDVKHVSSNDENSDGNGENNNLAAITKCLTSVDQTLMHSKVETPSKQTKLILPSQDPKLSSNISSFSDDHTVTKSSIIESQRVPSSVASSMDIEDQNSNTNAEQALNGRRLESSEIEHLSSLKPVPPIQEATHNRERDKLPSTTNSFAGNGELQPRLIEQDSEPYCSAVLTLKQSIPTSASCRDVLGLQTDITKTVLYENTKDKIMLEHDSRHTGAFCKELVLKPSHPCIVTLGEDLEQPSHAEINPLPIVSTQVCTAYEKDLFQDMFIKDERQLSAAPCNDSTINPTQQKSCDVRTNDVTKQQSVECDCGGSSNMLKDGLCSVGQSVASTFQSKFLEAISGHLKPDLPTFHSPHHQITLTTDLSPGAMTVNTLPRDAERISHRELSRPTVSSNDVFNSTVGTVLSQPTVTRASSAGARDFRYAASNETTYGILSANVTTARASSTDALTSQAYTLAGHILPKKTNIPHSSIPKISTKLDPDAVKNMSLHIIHHSGKRNIRCQKETTQEADRLSLTYSAPPASVNMTSHVASASNTSQNVNKGRQTSVTSVPNSYLARTHHSQFHVPRNESIQARIYSPYEECEHSHSSNQSSWQQGNVNFTKNIETSKHANSEHISTQLNPVNMIAKSASLSNCDRENFSMPHFTSSPSLNDHSFSNGFCNRPTTPDTQPLRSENQQVPIDLTSDSKSRGSLERFNSFSHILGSDVTNPNRPDLHASEHAGKLSPDSSNQDSNCQTNVYQADDSSESHEFPTEPLDLSLPKEHKRTPPCTGKVAVDLNSEHLQPDVQVLTPSTATSMCQPNLSVTENITVSPGVTPNLALYNTSGDTVSTIPSMCRNKDLFTLSNRSLTLAQNSLTNSLPATVFSARPQGLCHRSPLLETALLHNIVPKDRDPHPFNSVVPECLLPRPSSSDHRECRPLSNIQTDYKASQEHHSQPASLEPSSAPSPMHSTVPVCHHASLVISGTVISPAVNQSSQSPLPLLSNAKVTRHVGYNKNVQSGQHTSAITISQEQRTSSFTNQQQSTNLQSQYSNTVSALRHPSNNVVGSVGTMASKVVPLPVKDFFTHTLKENTYSALLMARITNKNKQNSGYQKVSELLRNYQSQNTAPRYAFEVDNNPQRNLVIDLTVSDDDCKLLPVCPQEHPSKNSRNLQVISNDHESLSVLELVNSRASETISPHKQNKEDLHYVDLSVCVSDSSNMQNNQSDKIGHKNSSFINTSNYNLTSYTEPHHIQEKCASDNNESYYENISITENNVHTKIVSTPVIVQSDKPAASTQPSAGYSYSYTANENSIKALRTTNSRESGNSAIDLKIDSPGKEIMAKKLRSAMSMRISPEETAQNALPLPLTCVSKDGTYLEAPQSPVHSFEEGIQTSSSIRVHDNSTQRAAATLLELSANPIYNPFIISPEISGDFQEKVYQIHPVLSDQENDKWDTAQDIQNNSFGFQSNQSNNVAGTKAHKNRSCRRVGRPLKDQYSTSDSVTLVKSTSISSNVAVPSSEPTNTSQASVNDTRLLHSVTPYSFSKVFVHPPNVACESQTPAVAVGPDSLSCMFPFHYECPDKSQFVRDMHGRTIATMENQSFRSDHAYNSQERNILENLQHTTSSSPLFKEGVFASVVSKTASDTMFSNTPLQTMTVNTEIHLPNGLNAVHNRNTGLLHTKSPITNISDFKNITIPQSESKCSVTNQQSPKHSVEYSVLPTSMVSGFLINNNAVFTKAKECTSVPGKHNRAQKRKYQNSISQKEENSQHNIMSSEAFQNIGFPLTSLANSFMPAEYFSKERNNNNIYSDISKSNKKKRASKGRVKKRKSKARNKNSKLLHHQTSVEHDANMDNKNPQDNQVGMWQAKKYMRPVDLDFQDDEQTIQYGLQDLQMIGDSENESQRSYDPISSTSTGFTLSDNLSWKTIVASDGISSTENNEHQKEFEVTSLLASMMCNKYKGQV